MTPVVDFLGQEIKPGQLAIYPVRQGANMWLNKVTVARVEKYSDDDEAVLHAVNQAGRRVRVTNLKNLVVFNHAAV